jgi:4'-phosphopantetheinyl transferase
LERAPAISVWTVDLAPPAGAQAEPLLQPDEISRAEKFQDAAVRSRWMRSRAALRLILARYCDRDPCAIRFDFGPFGKPFLRPPSGAGDVLQFSLARSGGICLIAVSTSGAVGIDLEAMPATGGDDDSVTGRVARHFFPPHESAAVHGSRGTQRQRAFLQLWTRKEAYCKALGTGLQVDLATLDVSREAGLALPRGDRACRVINLPANETYVGALAVCEGAGVLAPQPFFRAFSFSEMGAPIKA